MGSAEDQQARSLQKIAQHTGELVRVFTALNENVVALAKILKESRELGENKIDKDQIKLDSIDPNYNAVVHTSEFNNPEHRIRAFPTPDEPKRNLLGELGKDDDVT